MLRILLLLLISASLNGQVVYKTPSGVKYHLAGCRTVKNVSQEITYDEARAMGLLPCKVCRPEDIYANSAPLLGKARGKAETVQCKGFTKAGTRCKHRTSIGDGYCFQHKPK